MYFALRVTYLHLHFIGTGPNRIGGVCHAMVRHKLNLPPVALVVEDDYTTALLCARVLEPLGFQVMCCDSDHKAANVTQGHGHRIHLMLIDVVLASPQIRLSNGLVNEDGDGARLFTVLAHFCPQATAIQMSAHSLPELTEKGYTIQAKHFLQKPFTPAALRGLVRMLLPGLKVPTHPILPATEVTWYG